MRLTIINSESFWVGKSRAVLRVVNNIKGSCGWLRKRSDEPHPCFRILDGSLPEHPSFGRSVNFFAPKGEAKYWVRSNTPVFGYFFYYTLDMAVCPYLASIFANLASQGRGRGGRTFESRSRSVSNVLVLAMTCLRAVMQSFPGARTRMIRKK